MRVAVIYRTWGEIEAVIEIPEGMTADGILSDWHCCHPNTGAVARQMTSVKEMTVKKDVGRKENK